MRLAPITAALATALALGGLAPAPASATHGSDVVSGRIACFEAGRSTALPGARVELLQTKPEIAWMPRDILSALPDEARFNRVASGFSDSTGAFRLTDRSEGGEYRVRVVLRDSQGNHVRDFWAINDWSIDSAAFTRTAGRNRTGMTISLGTSGKCGIFRALTRSHTRLERLMAGNEPGVEIKTDALTAGVPFTNFDTINYPTGFASGAVSHEHGHVIRHVADGDYGHFLGDVARLGYMRNHTACLATNPGFAFNEGWAEYFSGEVGTANPCPNSAGASNVEGVVASTLAGRARTCLPAGSADQRFATMIRTLRANRGTIHSIDEFLGRHFTSECTATPPSAQITDVDAAASEVGISSATGTAVSATKVAARYAAARSRVLTEQAAVRASITRLTRTYVRGEAAVGVSALALKLRMLEYAAASLGRFDTAAEVTKHRSLTPEAKLKTRGCGVSGLRACPQPVRCTSSGPFGVGCVAGVPETVRKAYESGLAAMLAALAKQPSTAGVRSLRTSLAAVRNAYVIGKPAPGTPDLIKVSIAPTVLGSVERMVG